MIICGKKNYIKVDKTYTTGTKRQSYSRENTKKQLSLSQSDTNN